MLRLRAHSDIPVGLQGHRHRSSAHLYEHNSTAQGPGPRSEPGPTNLRLRSAPGNRCKWVVWNPSLHMFHRCRACNDNCGPRYRTGNAWRGHPAYRSRRNRYCNAWGRNRSSDRRLSVLRTSAASVPPAPSVFASRRMRARHRTSATSRSSRVHVNRIENSLSESLPWSP